MKRLLAVALLVGCAEPVDDEPEQPISAAVTRDGSGWTTISGCWYDGWWCSDGTSPIVVRWDANELVAPYVAGFLGGHYEASSTEVAGGDVLDVEFDGDIASVEMPFDNDFIVDGAPLHASTQTALRWHVSASSTETTLSAYWLCNDSQGGSYQPVRLATFETDPGAATLDILGSRPDDLRDRTGCSVSVGLRSEVRARGARLALVAKQVRTLDLILDTP
jgi:hypothetical protein